MTVSTPIHLQLHRFIACSATIEKSAYKTKKSHALGFSKSTTKFQKSATKFLPRIEGGKKRESHAVFWRIFISISMGLYIMATSTLWI